MQLLAVLFSIYVYGAIEDKNLQRAWPLLMLSLAMILVRRSMVTVGVATMERYPLAESIMLFAISAALFSFILCVFRRCGK